MLRYTALDQNNNTLSGTIGPTKLALWGKSENLALSHQLGTIPIDIFHAYI
jgi:hypothetical protein